MAPTQGSLFRNRWLVAVLSLAALLASSLIVAGCGGSDSSSAAEGGPAEVSDLSIELDWIPSPNHSVLYWAQDKGSFADEDLSVKLLTPSDPAAPLKLAATGKVDLAISYEPDVLQSAEQGLGVRVVGALFPRSLANFVASGESDVKGVADVEGENVGFSGIPTFEAYAKTELESAGLSESDVKLTNVGFNLVPALLSGNVAAITEGYSTIEVISIWNEQGVKPLAIPVTDLGVPPYNELVFVANAERLDSDPDYSAAIERFLAAYFEAYDMAKTMPEQVAKLMEAEADMEPEFAEKAVPEALALMEPGGGEPGCISHDAWSAYGDWMVEKGLLKSEPDVEALVTNDLLPGSCG
jgi:putative hydroxymethylpyrimidine transport system substrate-binding protein